MWLSRNTEYNQVGAGSTRQSRFIDRDFQLRYTLLLVGAAALGAGLIILPLSFFLNQNYEIFYDLAYDYSPGILVHLEREQAWIGALCIAVFLGLVVFFSLLGYRLTARIVAPLKIVRNHLRELSRGRWFYPPVKTRVNDEFQDFVEAYNYFYTSFQINLKRDYDLISKLTIDPRNKDAYQAWCNLLEEKAKQLNIPQEDIPTITFLSDEVDAGSPDSRHAS